MGSEIKDHHAGLQEVLNEFSLALLKRRLQVQRRAQRVIPSKPQAAKG